MAGDIGTIYDPVLLTPDLNYLPYFTYRPWELSLGLTEASTGSTCEASRVGSCCSSCKSSTSCRLNWECSKVDSPPRSRNIACNSGQDSPTCLQSHCYDCHTSALLIPHYLVLITWQALEIQRWIKAIFFTLRLHSKENNNKHINKT